MKREIKFRGKDNYVNGGWQYGLPYYLGRRDTWLQYFDERGLLDVVCVSTDTLGQFTGMKDCEGKEIYEGDILRFEGNHTTALRKVEWIGGGFQMVGITDVLTTDLPADMRWEVVGNIYDNPELIP